MARFLRWVIAGLLLWGLFAGLLWVPVSIFSDDVDAGLGLAGLLLLIAAILGLLVIGPNEETRRYTGAWRPFARPDSATPEQWRRWQVALGGWITLFSAGGAALLLGWELPGTALILSSVLLVFVWDRRLRDR